MEEAVIKHMAEKTLIKEWIDVDKIIDDNPSCSWYLIWGQRSNGKTYGIIDRSMRERKKFAYIRRYDTEIKRSELIDLISPHDIVRITNGRYNAFVLESGVFKYCLRDENGKILLTDPNKFGQIFAINTWEKYKGPDRGKFDYIIFDEFMSLREIKDEWDCFQQMLWTLVRTRADCKIIMLANSFTPYSLYFDELLIQEEVEQMRQGETIIKEFGETKILGHWCPPSSVTKNVTSKLFNFNKFKKKVQMAETGEWQIKDFPHCHIPYVNKPIEDGGDVIQFMYLDYRNHKMQIALCRPMFHERGRASFFIHCHFCKSIPKDARIVFGEKPDMYASRNYRTMRQLQGDYGDTEFYRILQECFLFDRVYFTTNNEGEFFTMWWNNQKLRFGW